VTRLAAYAIALAAALTAAWVVPALAMRALAPSLESSPLSTTNHRGRRVFLGLGLVWAVWAVSLLVTSSLLDAVGLALGAPYGSVEMLLFDGPLTMPLYAVPIILTMSAVVFGMVDDVFGTHGDKGFRGHLRALAAGRLSTGGLKMLGIGLVAAVYGRHALAGQPGAQDASAALLAGWWIAATLVIAFSANLLNLLDLRPGRALKSYCVLAVPAAATFTFAAVGQYRSVRLGSPSEWTAADTAVTLACLVVVLLGPVLAVWRYDLGERGMLGDAGSNAMGAVVGYLLAGSLPLPWLVGVAVLLGALNALSERVSFSRLIDASAPLRLLDTLGRLPQDQSAQAGGVEEEGLSRR